MSSDAVDAELQAPNVPQDLVRATFVQAIMDRRALQLTKDEAVKRELEKMEPLGIQIIDAQLDRLLRAAGILIMSLELPEARAVMAAIDLILDIIEDADLRERMAKRQESYEQSLIEMERDVRPLNPEETRALRKLTRGVMAAEAAKR